MEINRRLAQCVNDERLKLSIICGQMIYNVWDISSNIYLVWVKSIRTINCNNIEEKLNKERKLFCLIQTNGFGAWTDFIKLRPLGCSTDDNDSDSELALRIKSCRYIWRGSFFLGVLEKQLTVHDSHGRLVVCTEAEAADMCENDTPRDLERQIAQLDQPYPMDGRTITTPSDMDNVGRSGDQEDDHEWLKMITPTPRPTCPMEQTLGLELSFSTYDEE